MFTYYIGLGLISLKRNVALTVLLVAAIAVGIGASMTTLTVLRAMSGDPIPQKSQQLYVPQIDNWGPDGGEFGNADNLPEQLSYRDAMALMNAHAAKRQTAIYSSHLTVKSADPKQKPFKSLIRAVYSDFFAMFDVPFKFGRAWTASEDQSRAALIVLSSTVNDKIFGGIDSVGKTVTIEDATYTVTGVLNDWHPVPHFYDLSRSPFAASDDFFLPFSRAIDRHLGVSGNLSCNADVTPGWEPLIHSECIWIRFWVELTALTDEQNYRRFLSNYAAEQRRIGRFMWPARTQLRNVRQWLEYRHVVPSEAKILMLVSIGFLVVCLLNAMGLMLAKIMGRAGDIGVRRALGASRRAIFAQCLLETGVVGMTGGLVGLALTALGLYAARSLLPKDLAGLAYLDLTDVALTVCVSIGATMLAGLYPTWRAAGVQPAWQLKIR